MTDTQEAVASPPSSIERDDGSTIAYRFTPGKSPGVVFLTGFMSDMEGGKALALEAWCREQGRAFLRFDYTGHGASSGAFEDGTIGAWADDAVFALDHLVDGPQVLVGSSMGGWIMLLTALRRPERVVGLLGLAAAPDFTEDLIRGELSAEQQAAIERDGLVRIPNPYEPERPTPITRALIEDGGRQLLLRDTIGLDIPVRLIQGMRDADVPWQTALRLAEKLRTGDVEVQLVKAGDHRLSEPDDLQRLTATLDGLLRTVDRKSPSS